MRSLWFAALLVCTQALGGQRALAEDLSVLGADFAVRAGTGDYVRGMNEVVVSIQNNGDRRRQGNIRIMSDSVNPPAPNTRASAAFDVAPGADVTIRVPVFAMDNTVVDVESEDEKLFEQEFRTSPEQAARVFDAHDVPRLRAILENLPLNLTTAATPPPYAPHSPAPTTGGLRIRVVPAMYPRGSTTDSGRVLPARVPSWHGMHVVFMPTSRLRSISPDEFAALQGFTLAGGSLALSVSRPEDLEHERVVALIGDRAVATPPAEELTRSFPKPFAHAPEYLKYDKLTSRRDEVVLAGYRGGNLAPTVYGSSAPFGLGEVTLLSFDLDNAVHVDDPWVHIRLLELARQSYERRQNGTAGMGVRSGPPPGMAMGDGNSVQKILEGSTSVRWFAITASLLLCAYGVVAGPVLFGQGKKRGDLLLPLRLLPVLALATFALIVLVGALFKGRGKSSRLLYVETGAGLSVGVGSRYRGFFTPSSEEVDVGCSGRQNHLGTPYLTGKAPTLAIDGEQLRIGAFESQPSQTVIVREDGIFELGGAVDITRAASGIITVDNRTPHELTSVLLKSDTESWYFTRSIAAGSSFTTENKPSDDPDLQEWSLRVPPGRARPFDDHGFGAIFYSKEQSDIVGSGALWRALDNATTGPKRWFPKGVPVLLARVSEHEPAKKDSGVSIAESTFALRVVGFGAAR